MGRRKQRQRKTQPEDLDSSAQDEDSGAECFAVRHNTFEELEQGSQRRPDSPADNAALAVLNSELRALDEKLQRKRGKIAALRTARDGLKAKVDAGYEQIKQLKNSQNKAKSLEEHNRLLQSRNSCLQQEKEALETQAVAMDRETMALSALQKELDLMSGSGLEGLSLEQCQELLSDSTAALGRIEAALRAKTESLLASRRCAQCSGPRTVLVLPCGHFSLCESCAQSCDCCVICSCAIQSKVRVHSS